MAVSSDSDSWSPSHYLDTMLNAYEDDIKRESRLINEVSYKLNGNISVSVGLSPARGYLPIVKLMSCKKCITFTDYEWGVLITNQYHRIQEHVTKKGEAAVGGLIEENETVCDIFHLEFITRSKAVFFPTVKIKSRGVEINLNSKCVLALKKVLNLIENRMQRLSVMNFTIYYNYILNLCATEGTQPVDEYVRRYIQRGSTASEYTEQNDCLLEILIFELERFKQDVGKFVTSLSVPPPINDAFKYANQM